VMVWAGALQSQHSSGGILTNWNSPTIPKHENPRHPLTLGCWNLVLDMWDGIPPTWLSYHRFVGGIGCWTIEEVQEDLYKLRCPRMVLKIHPEMVQTHVTWDSFLADNLRVNIPNNTESYTAILQPHFAIRNRWNFNWSCETKMVGLTTELEPQIWVASVVPGWPRLMMLMSIRDLHLWINRILRIWSDLVRLSYYGFPMSKTPSHHDFRY
jgi:hypothetical protein